MAIEKPVKFPLMPFRCPRCKRETPYAMIISRFWRRRYWCEGCNSYFIARNDWLIGGLYGIVANAILVLTILGPGYRWFTDWEVSVGWLIFISMIIAIPISIVLWALFINKLLKYEYVGKTVN